MKWLSWKCKVWKELPFLISSTLAPFFLTLRITVIRLFSIFLAWEMVLVLMSTGVSFGCAKAVSAGELEYIHAFFSKQRFSSIQLQCCLTFSWIELQMLLRCCLMHISTIILRHYLHLLYLCSCLDQGRNIYRYLCRIYGSFFSFSSIFSLWFIV